MACLLPVTVAYAAGTGTIQSPSNGAAVASATAIEVQVVGSAGGFLDGSSHAVQARLSDLSGAAALPGTSPIDLSCSSNCGGDSTWTGPAFDPATLAPFGSVDSCNGGYAMQVRVDGGSWSGHGVRIVLPPAAPSDVAVAPDVNAATVTWAASPTPDISGYRIERRGGGGWTAVGEVAKGARSFTDDGVAAGEVEYRVLAQRGDGLANGTPAAPCSDTGRDLSTASSPVATTVRAPSATPTPTGPTRPTPTPSPSSTDGTGDGSGDGGEGPGDGSDDGSGDGSAGGAGTDGAADPDATESPDPVVSGAARRPGDRIAPPSSVGTFSNPGVSVPGGADQPQVADEGESYYGEGVEFSEEIDFGELGAVDALGEPTNEERVIRVPGALQSVLGQELELDRVLAPITAGMILLTFAMHLRRWARAGIGR